MGDEKAAAKAAAARSVEQLESEAGLAASMARERQTLRRQSLSMGEPGGDGAEGARRTVALQRQVGNARLGGMLSAATAQPGGSAGDGDIAFQPPPPARQEVRQAAPARDPGSLRGTQEAGAAPERGVDLVGLLGNSELLRMADDLRLGPMTAGGADSASLNQPELDTLMERPLILGPPPAGSAPGDVAGKMHLLDWAEQELVWTAVHALWEALRPLAGKPLPTGTWAAVVAQVKKPTAKVEKPTAKRPRGALDALYDPPVVAALTKLTTGLDRGEKAKAIKLGRQKAVLSHTFDMLLRARNEALVGRAPESLNDELAVLDEPQRKIVNPLYAKVRPNLLNEFHALDVGTEAALRAANLFYGKAGPLEPMPFGKVPVRRGRVYDRPLVHREMARRMRRAALYFERTFVGRTDVSPSQILNTLSIGGTDVRPNTNNPAEMSKHALGAAIDIDATRNPNMPGFPADFVAFVTGTDVTVDSAGQKKGNLFYREKQMPRKPQVPPADPATIYAEAARLRAASDAFRWAFRDEHTLGEAMLAAARLAANPPAELTAPELLAAVRAAAAEPGPVSWEFQPDAYAPPKSTSKPLLVVSGGGKGRRSRFGPGHTALAHLLFAGAAHQNTSVERAQRAVDSLVRMAELYRRSIIPDVDAKLRRSTFTRTPAKAVSSPSLEQVAVSGFFNLPPELVEALVAAEGGGLKSLAGSEGSTRDFHHFEIFDSDMHLVRPPATSIEP